MNSSEPCSPGVENKILEVLEASRLVVNKSESITTVQTVSFSFQKGEIYNLIGPSGAGKSSFLRLLNRLDEPTSGRILFRGKPLNIYPPPELRRRIVMLFQEPYLFSGTVLYNLEYCCPDKNRRDLSGVLECVGLPLNMADKDTAGLSVGERQRVALARAIILEPEVLLLDEPTSALDPASARIVEDLILGLVRQLCLTAIIVTHSPEQAQRFGGTTLIMSKGSLVESGPTEKLLTDPKTEAARKYIRREVS